uniref:Gag1-like clamp domain-containing protein n=1 Tax=Populus davidiana TaxID=266767 RepID=A0A6M2EV87_9ROSI
MYSRCSFLTQTGRSFGKKPFCSFAVFSGAYFRALLLLGMESFKRKCKAVFSSRGCFGCCAKPPTIIAIDASSKGRRVQKRSVKKSSKSNNFWSTSAGDMENSTMHSQGSLSSISTLNQQLDPSSAGSTSNSSEFVNRGVLLWNQTRQQWLGNKKTQNRKQVREPTISWNATYESLLGSNKPFARPVPLAEMVDFLVDVWEQEGLYD